MSEDPAGEYSTLALNTKVEESFVTPLTAIRGALEILRDFPDLQPAQRKQFIDTALLECARLARGVDELAETVYAAGERSMSHDAEAPTSAEDQVFADRVRVLHDLNIIDIDFSDYEFSSSDAVNDFFDFIDRVAERVGEDCFFAQNVRNCRIWPEAWVAYAHRTKKVRVTYALGTVRYVDGDDVVGAVAPSDPNIAPSREAALKIIADMAAG
jgi:hypothetical protein